MGNRPANHKFEMKKWENIKQTSKQKPKKTNKYRKKIQNKQTSIGKSWKKTKNEKNGTNPPSAINVNAIQSAREPAIIIIFAGERVVTGAADAGSSKRRNFIDFVILEFLIFPYPS